jgi:hypothetical protein
LGTDAWWGALDLATPFEALSKGREQSRRTLLEFEWLCRDFAFLERLARTRTTLSRSVSLASSTGSTPLPFRERLGVGPVSPLGDLRMRLELLGVFAFVMEDDHLGTLALEAPSIGRCILLPQRLDPSTLNLEFATALGRLIEYEDPLTFALDLLAPDAGLRSVASRLSDPGPIGHAEIAYLGALFGIPRPHIQEKLARLGIHSVRVPWEETGPRSSTPAWNRLPARYEYLAWRALDQGQISFRRMEELLRVDPPTTGRLS